MYLYLNALWEQFLKIRKMLIDDHCAILKPYIVDAVLVIFIEIVLKESYAQAQFTIVYIGRYNGDKFFFDFC